ncbi:MAG: hypothetical protein LUE21_02980 [Oscillospiraceae bacterium]|nr:hypothetical protein [Oscillospiraceae bacterium]
MDYEWLDEQLKPYYNHEVGRHGTDPVVLIKMVLIQHLYEIPALRQICFHEPKKTGNLELEPLLFACFLLLFLFFTLLHLFLSYLIALSLTD